MNSAAAHVGNLYGRQALRSRDEFVLSVVFLGYLAVLLVEISLLKFLPQRHWLWSWLHDACVSGFFGTTIATAVWAAWSRNWWPGRLLWAVLCRMWMFIALQVGMRALGMNVVGLSSLGVLLGFFGWATVELSLARWILGLALTLPDGRDSLHKSRKQFRVGHLLLWTAIIAATLTAARLACPPEPPEFLPSMVQYTVQWDTQAAIALQWLITLPLATVAVFRWRWLPGAAALAIAVIAISVLFDHWRGNAPFTVARMKPTLISTVRMNAAYLSQAVPLLLVVRALGWRLISTRAAASSPLKAEATC